MNKRILGYDLARAFAIMGMIVVNFKNAFNVYTDNATLSYIVEALEGKAASTFVILAGVGLSLMNKKSLSTNNREQLFQNKIIILKRSLFLFVIGLGFMLIWNGDILHYYAVYLVIGIGLISSKPKVLWLLALVMTMIYPSLLLFLDYDQGWNWISLEYEDFWTWSGFMRNLCFNGFHPVIPWLSFFIIGICLGRKDLSDKKLRLRLLTIFILFWLVINLGSGMIIGVLTENQTGLTTEDIVALFGTGPFPPNPFYLFSAMSFSIIIIIVCVMITETIQNSKIMTALLSMGQLSLTIYFAHVVIGIIGVMILIGETTAISLEWLMVLAMLFNIGSLIFSYYWKKTYSRGPLEWLMRKIAG